MFVHDEAGIHKIDFWAQGFTKSIFLATGTHKIEFWALGFTKRIFLTTGIHKIDFWALDFTKRIFLAIGIHGVLRAFHVFLFFEFCKKKNKVKKA